MKALPVAALVLLAACSPAPADNAANVAVADGVAVNGTEEVPVAEGDVVPVANDAQPANTAAGAPDYSGRWTGVEGMYLDVKPKPAGGVSLEMQWDLDNKGTFDGTVTPAGITFTRKGVTETLKPSDGDATGLKYLAGKKDCLTVKSGEGYCRD